MALRHIVNTPPLYCVSAGGDLPCAKMNCNGSICLVFTLFPQGMRRHAELNCDVASTSF